MHMLLDKKLLFFGLSFKLQLQTIVSRAGGARFFVYSIESYAFLCLISSVSAASKSLLVDVRGAMV